MGTERIRPGGPFIRQATGDSSSSQLPTFVSNANAPQVDYRLAAGVAFVIASVLPQGQGNAAEYQHGTHAQAVHQAETLKSDVFPSLRRAPARASPFFATAPQFEERPTRAIFQSVRSGQTPPVIPRLNAPPQLVDLTLQGSVFEPATPAAVVATYALAPLYAAPQSIDLTQQGLIFEPAAAAPVVVSYAFQPVYAAPQPIDLTQQGWILAPSLSVQGRVPAGIFAPQSDPSQLAALVIQSALTPPVAATGPVPPLVLTRQDDPSQLAAQFWRSIDIGSPPTPPAVQQPGGEPIGREPRRRAPPRFKRQDLAHLYDDFSEPEFLVSVEETLTEAAKPEKPPLLAEIGALSALDILSRAYGVHFESVKAARELIAERRLELVEEIPEEEMFAIIMILALADEP
jgi:hypothetical protein